MEPVGMIQNRRKQFEAKIAEINEKLYPHEEGYPNDWLVMANVTVSGKSLLDFLNIKNKRIQIGTIGPYFDTQEGVLARRYSCGDHSVHVPREYTIMEISQDLPKLQKVLSSLEVVESVDVSLGHYYPDGVLIRLNGRRVKQTATVIDKLLSENFPYYLSKER